MTRQRLAFLVALVLGVALIVALYTLTRQANARAVSSQNAALHAKDQTIKTLAGQLRAHGITPAVSPIPGATGGVGGTGGNGGNGAAGGKGGPGGNGGTGGPGGRGGNGAAVTVVLTPAPGPPGSPGTAGRDGADSTVPGPQGSPGAAGPDQCQWQDDPLRPGTQTCTRPSPTPEGTP